MLVIAASMAHGHRTAHGWAPSAIGGSAAVRSRRETIPFRRPVSHLLRRRAPTRVVTDEETIKPVFPGLAPGATTITIPGKNERGSTELLSTGSMDLPDAQRMDASVAND